MAKNEKSKYAKLLAKPIAFHRVYATIGGSACSGLFLSQAVFWSERTKNSEGWFYKTYAEWEQETALNRTELDKVRHHLTAMGIVETDLRGTPAKLHYRINYEIFDKYLDSVVDGTFIPSRPKNPNRKKFAEGQQTEVCGGSTNLQFAEGQQTSLQNVSKQDCEVSTNKFAECEQTILYTEKTTENTSYIPPLAKPTPEPHPKKEKKEGEKSSIPDDIVDRFTQEMAKLEETHLTANKNQDLEHPVISSSGSITSAAASASLVDSKHTDSDESPQTITAHTNSDEVKVLNKNVGSSARCDRQFEVLSPWRVSKKRNAYNPKFLDYLQKQYLPSTSYYSGRQVTRGNACEWISVREYDEQKLSQLEARWMDFEEITAPAAAPQQTFSLSPQNREKFELMQAFQHELIYRDFQKAASTEAFVNTKTWHGEWLIYAQNEYPNWNWNK